MTDAVDHESAVSTGGRTITNFRFADDIDDIAGKEEELAKLAVRLNKGSTVHGMEIIAEKTTLMTTTLASTQRSKQVDGGLRKSQASSTWAQL